jgi:iron(II)-dependent oxidoreductase
MAKLPLRRIRQAVLAVIGLASIACLALGWHTHQLGPAIAGVVGLAFLGTRPARCKSAPAVAEALPARAVVPPRRPPVDPHDTAAVIERMLADGRYALLLCPATAKTLGESQLAAAVATLDQSTAMVPEGDVLLGTVDELLDDVRPEALAALASGLRVIRVQPLFLDRYPVTNRQYYEFVAAGAYGEMPLWDEAIWPAVFDFVDRTGSPGPRFWRDGCYPAGKEDHPVVGVSWFEADAYARWAGRRLPSDAEWVKAACWPVALSPGVPLQRRYPWGDSMDRSRANLWGSGPGDTVPVTEFAQGASVGGVCQLIGNVWEWTAENFRPSDHPSGDVSLSVPMKCIRGGAFDTYFDNQASCRFASGENPLGRKHNIGFRCALSLSDVMLGPDEATGADAQQVAEVLA